MSPGPARAISRPIVPVALALIVFGALLARTAVPISGGDTPRLLEEAVRLAAGDPLGARGTAFLLPHVLIAAVTAAGLPLAAYIVLQVSLSIAAAAALFFLARRAGAGDLAAAAAASLWALNLSAQRFNLFLLSDGLYQSLMIVAALAVLRAIERVGPGRVLAAGVALAAIAVCRPQGRGWPFVVAILLVWRHSRSVRHWAVAAGLVAAALALLSAERDYTVQMNLVQYFSSGQIIWGYSDLRMSMPAWAGTDAGGLSAVAEYGLQHPVQALLLVASRIVAELSTVRPFYSAAHNTALAVVHWPLIALAVYAWINAPATPLKALSLLVVASHLAVVGIAHADWDGRWFLEIAPFVYLWGSAGLMKIAGVAAPRP